MRRSTGYRFSDPSGDRYLSADPCDDRIPDLGAGTAAQEQSAEAEV